MRSRSVQNPGHRPWCATPLTSSIASHPAGYALPVPAKELCVAEILAPEHKTTGKTGDDRQHESHQPDKYERVHPDRGSSCDGHVVDLRVHASIVSHGSANIYRVSPQSSPQTLRPFRGRTYCRLWVASSLVASEPQIEMDVRYDLFNEVDQCFESLPFPSMERPI